MNNYNNFEQSNTFESRHMKKFYLIDNSQVDVVNVKNVQISNWLLPC